MDDDARTRLLVKFATDPILAHDILFRHRHPNATPDFHHDMIRSWHGSGQHEIFQVFRGGAKSTIAEEGIVLDASFRRYKNFLLLGATYGRAVERLHAVKHELEQNEFLIELFGDQRGATWGEEAIELANGVYIQALGRGQSLRGIKRNDQRPDFVFWDDIEDEESTRIPDGRRKTARWFLNAVLPAMDAAGYKSRGAATPLDPEDLVSTLAQPGTGFRVHKYPVEYLDEVGERRATWPDREPLEIIDQRIQRAMSTGTMREYRMEYMLEAESPEDKPFRREMFRIEPQVRSWQAVYGLYDPARTVNRNSATTGFAGWSWFGPRLIVWDAWAKMLMPDQIIADMFDFNERFSPVEIFVEEDGLNEWLLQPIRHEQTRRGVMLPIRPVRAPKGKMDFIRGLQPFFNAREITFTQQFPDLESQLINFPTGRIDAPNALAYAPRLRPGAPVYEDFGAQHVAEDLRPFGAVPVWLALNATSSMVTAAAVQFTDGFVRVLWDAVREGEPSMVLADIIREAQLETAHKPRLMAPSQQFDKYLNSGLVQAARRLPADIARGQAPETGRAEIASWLRRDRRGESAFMVSEKARWTLNAFAGGYARAVIKGGMLAPYAVEGVYRTLMEGLESYCAILAQGSPDEDRGDIHYARTADGRRYVSALGNR